MILVLESDNFLWHVSTKTGHLLNTSIVYLEFSVTVHLLQRSNLFLKVTVKLPLEHKYSVEPSI
jgi:hypothetical protein